MQHSRTSLLALPSLPLPSFPLPPSSATTPYLPPELVTLILRERQTSKRTLAACCLVQKSWLDIARKYLYQSIEIELFKAYVFIPGIGGSDSDSEDDDGEWEFEGFKMTKRTTSLLETLRRNPRLASLPLSMILSSTEEEDKEGFAGEMVDPEEALDSVLSLAPNVKALALDNDAHDFYYVLDGSTGERYEAIKVSGIDAWRALCRMTNLKHLDIYHLAGVSRSTPPLPHPLETLTCQSTRTMRHSVIGPPTASPSHFHNMFHLAYSTLRSLDIPWTSLPELDPQRLTNLEDLKLHSWGSHLVPASQHSNGPLSLFRNLSTLTFSGDQDPNLDTVLKSWPTRLPGSLCRINLDHAPSLDVLLAIVLDAFSTSGATKQLSIRFRQSSTVKDTQYLTMVRLMCENAGIELFLRDE